jgi:hypothetical protein
VAIDYPDDPFERWQDRPSSSRGSFDDSRKGPAEVTEVDPERDLPGSVYAVPDSYWGFEAPGRTSHPGACSQCSVAGQHATFVKGTDVRSSRPDITPILLIQPSEANGLSKETAFALAPRRLRLHKAVLLHYNRRMGVLDPEDLARLRGELTRLFGQPPGGV